MLMAIAVIGVIFGSIGSLLLAFSVIKNPGGAYQVHNDKEVFLATIVPNRFRWGAMFLLAGSMLQLLAFFIPNA